FQRDHLAVFGSFLTGHMASFNEPPGYAASSARLGLDKVVDGGLARVCERLLARAPALEHLRQGLIGRILCFLHRGAGPNRVTHQLPEGPAEELLKPVRCGHGSASGSGSGSSAAARFGSTTRPTSDRYRARCSTVCKSGNCPRREGLVQEF